MIYKKIYLKEQGVSVEASVFPGGEGVTEWHVMLHVEPRGENFLNQMRRIYEAEDMLPEMPDFIGGKPMMKRYFLSDSANQSQLMRQDNAAISVIQQPPLDGSKLAAWLYLASNTTIRRQGATTVAEHNGYRHLWTMGMKSEEGDSEQQTYTILNQYEELLESYHANLKDHCIRTWFFVRDVDTQYAGMVKARRENFKKQGLTEKTHYIASTGIGGIPPTLAAVQMGAYAITGIEPQQTRFLYAPSHLNPTSQYGVTFERGTVVDYGDRRHVIISGTASINNKGEVMHEGDIVMQTRRMLENVETLLAEGGATYNDVAQLVVYLRDIADFSEVRGIFAKRFPDIPTVFTLAPVCRPSWLIEIECLAILPQKTDFRAL